MTNGLPILEARQLSKEFGHRFVLDRLDFAVAGGEAVALMGANGCGKTTLLRCLGSLLRPSSGEMFWFGRRAGADPELRRALGVVGHESGLYSHLTVQENLLFAARMYDVPDPRPRVSKLLHSLGLQSHGTRLVADVSRGMRQRVAIGRALVHEPTILLMDEPFAGLDSEGVAWLSRSIREWRDLGRAICFSTHDEAGASQLVDRIAILRVGKLCTLERGRGRVCA